MRQIEVSTEVFAKLWSHRLDGEETEDAILRRLLGVTGASQLAPENKEVSMRRLWREDVRDALSKLGGSASLGEIYRVVRDTRRAEGRRIPPSLDAIVRRELEYNSSDSESYTGRFNWFRSVNGIGAGVWAIRG